MVAKSEPRAARAPAAESPTPSRTPAPPPPAARPASIALRLYSAGWWIALPFAFVYLFYRSLRQPAYRQHWRERLGLAAGDPAGPVVWIHAVSVGETRAVMPLIRRLAAGDPELRFLLTHTTPTGRQAGAELQKELDGRLAQCYVPYDLPFAITRFLRRWRPVCGLIVETEVWPNLIRLAHADGVRLGLINGRLSERSLRKARLYGGLIREAVAALDLVAVQSDADAARLATLGRKADLVAGNMKFDQEVSRLAHPIGLHWRRLIGRRPIIVAASTREGEERLLLERWSLQVLPGHGRRDVPLENASRLPLLIIVPRHPQRFASVATMMAEFVATPNRARRSAIDEGAPAGSLSQCVLLLGDSMGEMQQWYATADVAIMGGSLLPFGSQNLIEANALGCPVVLGPSTFNFEQAAAESIAAGAARRVADTDEALTLALRIAGNQTLRADMSRQALAFAAAHRGATGRTLTAIEPLLHAAGRVRLPSATDRQAGPGPGRPPA